MLHVWLSCFRAIKPVITHNFSQHTHTHPGTKHNIYSMALLLHSNIYIYIYIYSSVVYTVAEGLSQQRPQTGRCPLDLFIRKLNCGGAPVCCCLVHSPLHQRHKLQTQKPNFNFESFDFSCTFHVQLIPVQFVPVQLVPVQPDSKRGWLVNSPQLS